MNHFIFLRKTVHLNHECKVNSYGKAHFRGIRGVVLCFCFCENIGSGIRGRKAADACDRLVKGVLFYMKKQIQNPYLPLDVYIPDCEPRVFGDRVYVYGSHDKQGGERYCMLDYVCYSAPVTDLSEWRDEGVIYQKTQDPHNTDGSQDLWAPDVVRGVDGRYYLYYVLSMEFELAAAVSDSPTGPFEYYGRVHYEDGRILRENYPFDPGVLVESDAVYLYYGFAPSFPTHRTARKESLGASLVILASDMLTVVREPVTVIPSKKYAQGTSFEGHAFFEACSIRKIDEYYYLLYASEHAHELCYGYSRQPDGGFIYGGIVISNADIGYQGRNVEKARNPISNNHGGLAQINGKWYIFYHRHTHGTQFSRQGMAEKIGAPKSGVIGQVEMTSNGLAGGPFATSGTYPAAYACNLYGKERGVGIPYGGKLSGQPVIVYKDGMHYVTNLCDNGVIGWKYFVFEKETKIVVSVRGSGGMLEIFDDERVWTNISITDSMDFREYEAVIEDVCGVKAVYLRYMGKGSIDVLSISFI